MQPRSPDDGTTHHTYPSDHEPSTNRWPMLLCGAEEPLAPNPQIYALDEVEERVVLCDFGVADARRYSFLWLGPPAGAPARLSAVLEATARALAAPMVLCAAWAASKDRSLASAQRKARWQHEKDGWSLGAQGDLTIATKPIAPGSLGWPPRDPGARTVLFLGSDVTLEALAQPEAASSLRTMAGFRMAPSAPFLTWLAARRWAVVYPLRDDLGRPGCIVAGGLRVPVRDLEAAGWIQETRWSHAAREVWQMPP